MIASILVMVFTKYAIIEEELRGKSEKVRAVDKTR